MITPCDWPVSYAACGDAPTFDAELLEQAESLAVEFLWRWTRRSLGLCPDTLIPEPLPDCSRVMPDATDAFLSSRVALSGWPGWSPLHTSSRHLYHTPDVAMGHEVLLPLKTHAVTAVRIEDVTLADSEWNFDTKTRVLRREDGSDWPALGIDWEVDIQTGTPVPHGGQVAAGVLAIEFAKALCSDNTCALPQRVQTVTRQGVTVGVMQDTFEDLRIGRTGIWLIDSWVSSMTMAPQGATVASPDFNFSRKRSSGPGWYGNRVR